MDYYKILGVNEKASKEEIKQAYENQVNKFNIEIQDKKRAEKFLKLFKEAHDNLITEIEESEIIDQYVDLEISTLVKNINNNTLKVEERREITNNDFEGSSEDNDIEETLLINHDDVLKEIELEQINSSDSEKNHLIVKRKDKPKKKIKNSNNKNLYKINRNKDKFDNEVRNKDKINKQKVIVKNEKELNENLNLILLPLKILVVPIIVILELITLICKIISMASWLVSKVIIIIAIGGTAIHGYQIYTGQAPMYWEIFALCLGGFIIALFLPYVIRVIPRILDTINKGLKCFVF